MEMERGENIMVVTHQAVLRCIYAYFMNVPQDQSPWMEIPLHTVIKLTPRAYGTQVERYLPPHPCCSSWSLFADKRPSPPPRKKILKKNSFKAEIPAVSTFRAKYASANMGAGSMDGKHVSPVVAKLLPQSNMIAPVEAMVDGTQGGSMAIAE